MIPLLVTAICASLLAHYRIRSDYALACVIAGALTAVAFGLIGLLTDPPPALSDMFDQAGLFGFAGYFAGLSTALIVGIPFDLRRIRRAVLPGCCAKCGYDLTGNTSGRCPECGRPINAKTTEHTPADPIGGEPAPPLRTSKQ